MYISVSSHRKFDISCDRSRVEAHFRNFEHMLQDLPGLTVNRVWGPDQYRISYNANVAGIYQVDLFSDVKFQLDTEAHELVVSPLYGHMPITPKATLTSLTGHGEYACRLAFYSQKEHTTAEYDLTITANIPKPVRLSFLPNSLARRAIQVVVQRRVQEITDVFIARTIHRLNR